MTTRMKPEPFSTLDDGSGLLYGNGCTFYHDCFSCPFSRCRFDSDAPVRMEQRKATLAALHREQPSLSQEQLAQALGVSRRTVVRLLKKEE